MILLQIKILESGAIILVQSWVFFAISYIQMFMRLSRVKRDPNSA